jgi:hypothetical protein
MNYLESAKRLLGPDCPVSGQGRWCLKTPMAAYLFETREAAVASLLDPNDRYCRVFDLVPGPLPKCMNRKDDAEDRAWERRQQGEKKQA